MLYPNILFKFDKKIIYNLSLYLKSFFFENTKTRVIIKAKNTVKNSKKIYY